MASLELTPRGASLILARSTIIKIQHQTTSHCNSARLVFYNKKQNDPPTARSFPYGMAIGRVGRVDAARIGTRYPTESTAGAADGVGTMVVSGMSHSPRSQSKRRSASKATRTASTKLRR